MSALPNDRDTPPEARETLFDDLALLVCGIVAVGVYTALAAIGVSLWAFVWLLVIPLYLGLRILCRPINHAPARQTAADQRGHGTRIGGIKTGETLKASIWWEE